jgi:hypothetical protein
MSILAALMFASSAPNPLMVSWAQCMMAYSDPRLRTETVEQLIEGSFASCPTEERAFRQFYVDKFGEQVGVQTFERLKQGMRGMMRERLTAVKKQLADCEATSGQACGVQR